MKRHKALIPLSHQHQHALALCVKLRRGLAGVEAVREAFAGEIALHFRAEEEVLFPTARAHQVEMSLVRELLREHRQMEKFVAGLDPHRLKEFAQLLDDHVRKEERRLFPAMEKALPPEAMRRLGEQLQTSLQ